VFQKNNNFIDYLLQMDLQDQLKNLFPDHEPSNEVEEFSAEPKSLWIQKEPMICKFEKRKGKPTTIIAGYDGEEEDFKILAKEIKNKFAVGGSYKDGEIIIQGNYRDKIMQFLQEKGFKTKRVGG
jgi:translation initiation factor 1